METIALTASKRQPGSSRLARAQRRNGKIPAILYGHGMTPLPLEVEKKKLLQALHTKAGENVILDLKVEGTKLKESTCRIKDIQHNPVTEEIQHVDFTVISLQEKIEVNVALHAVHGDEALGVKEGGVLDVVHHELPIECLPTQIPEKIEFDVKQMKISDAIHVKDLKFPEGVVCKLDPDEIVIALHPPMKEEVAKTEEEATQPEVIEKGKKEKEEEGAEVKPAAAEKKPAAEKKE